MINKMKTLVNKFDGNLKRFLRKLNNAISRIFKKMSKYAIRLMPKKRILNIAMTEEKFVNRRFKKFLLKNREE